jgi:TonB-like protein
MMRALRVTFVTWPNSFLAPNLRWVPFPCAGLSRHLQYYFWFPESTHRTPPIQRPSVRSSAKLLPCIQISPGESVSGVVKLVALVAPNGPVKSTEAVGGNPVLIRAAVDAVKGWKFAPALNETREVIELRFSVH